MKPNNLSKPSLANLKADFNIEALLANALDNVAKDETEMVFDWDNALVSQNYDDLKSQRIATSPKKQPVTIRIDSDILSAFKATGKGWQTRINEALRQSLATQGKLDTI